MALVDRFLAISPYRWDPSAFSLLCRAFMAADHQDVFDFIANVQLISYDEFLSTVYWGIVSGWKIYKRGVCSCGYEYGLQVHHKTYAHHGEEHRYLDDLVVKCRLCHKEIHGLANPSELLKITEMREKAGRFRHLKPGAGGDMEHVSSNVISMKGKLL